MASISVKRSVGVVVIVTEEFKEELKTELRQAAEEAQRRIEQMELQSRRYLAELQRTDLNQAIAARRQIEAERRRQDALKQEIQRQVEEAEKLEIGSEYPRGTLESMVELQHGDDLTDKLTGSQIVIKDGVIVDVREA
jgi:hypothetical protein